MLAQRGRAGFLSDVKQMFTTPRVMLHGGVTLEKLHASLKLHF
jgi:hypothetical protein